MTRARGEIPEPEEQLLGIVRPTEEQEAEDATQAAQTKEFRRLFIVAQMQNGMFREWLMGHLEAFGTFINPFAASPNGFPDQNATWLQAGMKSAGWALWEEMDRTAPELASLMRREHAGRG